MFRWVRNLQIGPRLLLVLEMFGRVVELLLCLVLHPVLVGARRVRGHGRVQQLSQRVARFISPSSSRTGPVEKESDPDDDPPEPAAAKAAERTTGLPARSVPRIVAAYLLVVATVALLTVMRRVDSALQQMHGEGSSAGSALGFDVSLGNLSGSLGADSADKAVLAVRYGWEAYRADVADATPLRDPLEVATSLVWLDACFIVLYGLVGAIVLVILHRLNAQTVVASDRRGTEQGEQQRRRGTMLATAGAALLLLMAVDVVEDVELYRALVRGDSLVAIPGGPAIGPLASLLKLVLTIGVFGPALLVAAVLMLRQPAIQRALTSLRGPVYALIVLAVLMSIGIGAAQLDDVIRAWHPMRAIWAVVTCAILAITITGAARQLTKTDPENPRPDIGRSAQPLLLGAGLALVGVGLLLNVFGQGWGLAIPGALLIGLWALGVPFAGLPRWTEVSKQPAFGLRVPKVSSEAAEVEPAETPGLTEQDVARLTIWGDRLGRFAGSAVLALLVMAIARATALDAYIRATPDWSVLLDPVLAATAATVCGAVVAVYRPRGLLTDAEPRIRWWKWTTLAAVIGGVVLAQESLAISSTERLGTAGVIFGGFTLLLGGTAWLVMLTRRGAVTAYALAPALRVIRLRRFPVISFLVLWILVVSAVDKGGYHDIRRGDVSATGSEVPTLARAWTSFVGSQPAPAKPAAGKPVPARPVVMVGAQGGGIRAAVWTSLVMECIFGPGPVGDSGDTCAYGADAPNRDALASNADQPLPIFLASGASGGSVGLAAWSARRTDLLQDGAPARTPLKVEQGLNHDFVAPDLARLLLADLPHTLLARDTADRAEMLERGWEAAWPGPDDTPLTPESRGMSRGLRQLWDVTHEGKGWGSPVLALNGVGVEDGCRFVASAIDFTLPAQLPDDPLKAADAAGSDDDQPDDAACRGPVRPDQRTATDVLPSTGELVDYLCPTEDVPLSTAAHLSARFPFVSPTGRVARKECQDDRGLVPMPAVSYDADGGFFDNSGAGTAVDAWRALQPLVTATERQRGECLAPVFIQIDNSPPEATIASTADARPTELVAPLNATLGEVSSREGYARAAAAAAFTRPVSAGGQVVRVSGQQPDSLWFRVTLFGQPGPEPPLGWTLAEETVDDMRAQLRAKSNAEHIKAIRDLLRPGQLTCQ